MKFYLSCLAGIMIGLFGMYSWYLETYTDSPVAALWRSMGDRNDKETSGSSLAPLLIFSGFFLSSFSALLIAPFGENSIMRAVLLIAVAIACVLIIIGFICFLPFPVPRWADARYQYMKRHNLLDENGDPLPQSQWPDSEITPADDPEEKEP